MGHVLNFFLFCIFWVKADYQNQFSLFLFLFLIRLLKILNDICGLHYVLIRQW